MFRRLMVLIGAWLTVTVSAQELQFVDLGVVEGEFKQLQREVYWVNGSNDEVKLKLVSKNKKLQPDRKQVVLAGSDTLRIPFTIDIPALPGYYEYELQLIGNEDFLLHGFQFGVQVLAAEQDIFKAYRNTQWPFRTKERVLNLKAGYKGDTLSSTFDVFNMGGSDLKLDEVYVSDSIWVSFQPKLIKHNQFGQMTIQMRPSENAPSGFQKIPITLKIAEDTLSNLPIQFTLLPPRKYADEETVSGGPTITSSLINHDFKVMEVGQIRSVDIKLANVGNEELKLERLESNCDCLTYELEKKTMGSGESIDMKVTFNATGRIGLERKTLAIFSNDPSNPTLVITFRAHVK